jgi:hypothetical protein
MYKNKIFYFLLILFTLVIHNTFLNTYIIYKNNYETRVLKYGGFCEPQGYGFIKFIRSKYKINYNFVILNFKDFSPIDGYFHNFNNVTKNNYIALIGITNSEFSKNYKPNYIVIEKVDNCYFIKKND